MDQAMREKTEEREKGVCLGFWGGRWAGRRWHRLHVPAFRGWPARVRSREKVGCFAADQRAKKAKQALKIFDLPENNVDYRPFCFF